MESRIEGIENQMKSMVDLLGKLSNQVEQIALTQSNNRDGETSANYGIQGSGGGSFQRTNFNSSIVPKQVKTDFPRFDGTRDSTFDSRYNSEKVLDFFGQLTKLRRKGTVQEYQVEFERLLAKASSLPQDRKVSYFISGLRDAIRIDVQANIPSILSNAISLARLYEARDFSYQRGLQQVLRSHLTLVMRPLVNYLPHK